MDGCTIILSNIQPKGMKAFAPLIGDSCSKFDITLRPASTLTWRLIISSIFEFLLREVRNSSPAWHKKHTDSTGISMSSQVLMKAAGRA